MPIKRNTCYLGAQQVALDRSSATDKPAFLRSNSQQVNLTRGKIAQTDATVFYVFKFHAPADTADLDRDENWTLAGRGESQHDVLFDEGRIIGPIGSYDGEMYVMKEGKLILAGSALRGKWHFELATNIDQVGKSSDTAPPKHQGTSAKHKP